MQLICKKNVRGRKTRYSKKLPPFSANVFEARYGVEGADLLPISWTSFITFKFQSCSLNKVGFDSGSDRIAPQEDVITIRCTWDLVKSQYKCAYIKVAMHTRSSVRFWAYQVSHERRVWWPLSHMICIHERVLCIVAKYLRTFGILGTENERRSGMLNCIYTFDYLVKCSFLKFRARVRDMLERYQVPTFTISSTTTTSNLSPYPSDSKYSIIYFPFSSVRTVPRTVKPLSRRVRTTHMAIYPLAPETRTLDPFFTEGIPFEGQVDVRVVTVSVYSDKRYLIPDKCE